LSILATSMIGLSSQARGATWISAWRFCRPVVAGSVLGLTSLGLWIWIRRQSLKGFVRFRIRTLLAVTAGFACVAWIIAWLVRNDSEWQQIVMALLWAIGSLIGMYACRRPARSTLIGSILGGWTVVVIWAWTLPIGPKAHLGFSIAILQLWLAVSAGASSILAVVVGVLREGITISREKDKE